MVSNIIADSSSLTYCNTSLGFVIPNSPVELF